MAELLDQLRDVHARAGAIIGSVGSEQWRLPTPCLDWDVAAVVRHVVVGNRLFAAVLGGDDRPPRELLPALMAEVQPIADTDLPAAYAESATQVDDGFAVPGALEGTYRIPVGELSGELAAHIRIIEGLVHGWDVATAIGVPADFPDDVAEQEVVAAQPMLSLVPAERKVFGEPQPVADDAPPLDRLVALLGRPVG